MTSSLVGSEMCIRDSICRVSPMAYQERVGPLSFMQARAAYGDKPLKLLNCLLYTSDAADDM
eukprot:10956161-Prorocentrum_lima.AAC.1